MMLLGFPKDYKSERHIHNAISDFGKVILWEESHSFLGRIMVRARVTSIHAVPQFIVYYDSMDMNGDSWTIQCEVVQHHQLGEGPPHEDPVPDELELEHVVPFDFFGLGQPVLQQDQNDQQENVNLQQEQGNGGHNLEQLQQLNPWDPWAPWPTKLPAQQLAQPVQDLNIEPTVEDGMEIDLNMPGPIDPLEVIINPANPLAADGFLELNDFIEEVEENIPQQMNPEPAQ